MIKKSYFTQLEELTSRFYIFISASAVSNPYIDVFDFDKFGNVIEKTGRRYKSINLRKAVSKAYSSELCKNDSPEIQMKTSQEILTPTQN